jgi:hypothetical protein
MSWVGMRLCLLVTDGPREWRGSNSADRCRTVIRIGESELAFGDYDSMTRALAAAWEQGFVPEFTGPPAALPDGGGSAQPATLRAAAPVRTIS